jgi:hypothetical protein
VAPAPATPTGTNLALTTDTSPAIPAIAARATSATADTVARVIPV